MKSIILKLTSDMKADDDDDDRKKIYMQINK